MVSGQFCFSVNQREGQIITEYLAVLVESRIKCETTHTSPDILTEIMASRLEPRLHSQESSCMYTFDQFKQVSEDVLLKVTSNCPNKSCGLLDVFPT